MTDREWFSAQELADWLGIKLSTVYWWSYAGGGPRRHRIGRELRFRKCDVERWLKGRADE